MRLSGRTRAEDLSKNGQFEPNQTVILQFKMNVIYNRLNINRVQNVKDQNLESLNIFHHSNIKIYELTPLNYLGQ